MEKVYVEEDEIGPYDEEETDEEEYVNKNNGYLIEEKTNLIYQLKNQNYIPSYSFMIKFDNTLGDKGNITIGGKPHEYDPSHFSEQFYFYQYTNLYFGSGDGYRNWGITFKDIQYNGIIYGSLKTVEITIDFGFILANQRFLDYLDNEFFKNTTIKKYCSEELIENYIFKICKESVIKYFKNISFIFSSQYNSYNQTFNMEFDYKDLFIKAPGENDLYYFQIIFQENYIYSWKLGLHIFKNIQLFLIKKVRLLVFIQNLGNIAPMMKVKMKLIMKKKKKKKKKSRKRKRKT